MGRLWSGVPVSDSIQILSKGQSAGAYLLWVISLIPARGFCKIVPSREPYDVVTTLNFIAPENNNDASRVIPACDGRPAHKCYTR